MKQHTRIARLIRNKRVKKLANFATVAILVCPLAIGAVKALAENVEETPATEEVTSVEIGKEKEETLELEETPEVANSVLEVVPETKKVESEPVAPYIIDEGSIDDYDLGNFQLQFFPVQERMFALEDKGVDVSSAVVIQQKIHKYLIDFGDHPSGDWNQLIAWLNEFDAEVTRLENENTWQKPNLSALQAVYDSVGSKEQYTPESWASFTEYGNGTGNGYWYYESEWFLTMDDETWEQWKFTQAKVDELANGLQNAINTILVKKGVDPEPEVKVNVTINYVSSENGIINTLTQEAVKGKAFTVTAPDVYKQSTGPKYFRTSAPSQTIASASEGSVITFNYDRIVGVLNDVYIDGATSATVGDSVTYREKSVTQFNYGDPRIDYSDITADKPLVISDPSAAEITAGTVKFLKAGTYTLSGGNASEDLIVTVSEADTVTPDPTVEKTEWFVTGGATAKPGDVNTIGIDERVTYSDGSVVDTPNITIPMLYTLASTDPSDTIVGNSITYGNEGERTVTFMTMGRAGTFSIRGLNVKVSNGAVTPSTDPVDPKDPSKPILPKPEAEGSATGTINSTTLVKNKLGNAKTSSKVESEKNLPQTGEKETYIMFLSGLVTLGGMLVAVIKRKRKEV